MFTVGVAGKLHSIAAAGWQSGPTGNELGPAVVNVVEILPDGTPDTSHFLGQARFSTPASGLDEFDLSSSNIMVEPGEKLGLLVYRAQDGMILFGSGEQASGAYGLSRINVTGGTVGPWQPSGNMLFYTTVDRFEPLPGDVNVDGAVDLADFGILKAHFGQAGARAEGDLTGDGRVDISDFGELKNSYGNVGPGPVKEPVPEPSTLALLAVGALVLGIREARSNGQRWQKFGDKTQNQEIG